MPCWLLDYEFCHVLDHERYFESHIRDLYIGSTCSEENDFGINWYFEKENEKELFVFCLTLFPR